MNSLAPPAIRTPIVPSSSGSDASMRVTPALKSSAVRPPFFMSTLRLVEPPSRWIVQPTSLLSAMSTTEGPLMPLAETWAMTWSSVSTAAGTTPAPTGVVMR